MTAKVNLVIQQGETFSKKFVWCSGADVIKAIAAVSLAYPCQLTVTSHGLPTIAIPVAVVGDVPAELKTSSIDPANRILGLKTAANTLTLDVNTTDSQAYSAGGYLRYTPPVDLSTYTARMMVRQGIASSDTLLSLTDGAGITLDAEGGITITMTDVQTAAFASPAAIYDLEVVSGGGVVTRLFAGNITLSREVTHA